MLLMANARGSMYRCLVLHEALVVSAECSNKHEAVDSLETVNPLFALRALASNVEHMVVELAEFEQSLCNTRST